jgi:hypothetical protein
MLPEIWFRRGGDVEGKMNGTGDRARRILSCLEVGWKQ